MKHLYKLLIPILLLIVSQAAMSATYFSYKASAPFTFNFSSLTNWNTSPIGVGTNPVAGDLTSGAHIFIIQTGYDVTVDQNISVNTLTLQAGPATVLTIGNSATGRAVTVGAGGCSIATNATLQTANIDGTHTITFNGALAINGTLDLRQSSARVTNTTFGGTYSITGSGPQPEFNNVVFSSGNVTAARSLDIRGNLTINAGATFTSGAQTHNLYGNWSQSGTHTNTGSTIVFANNLVQSITTAATFNNLSLTGGGIVSVSGTLTVGGAFSVSGNTTVSTGTNHTFNGDFSIADGSTFTASGGTVTFGGAVAQAININSNATFNAVTFSNGGASNPKTIAGNLTLNGLLTVSGGVNTAQVGGSGNHTFRNGVTMNGTSTFSGTVTITNGTVQDTDNGAFNFGTAAITTTTGAITINTNTTWTVNNNFTVASGSLIISNNCALVDGSGTASFTLSNATNLYVRGSNNFPSGFASFALGTTSNTRYDAALAQTVRGNLTYGTLTLTSNTKTVDGPITVAGNIDLNSSVTLALGTFAHTFTGATILNSATRNGSITSSAGGSFTFAGVDINQTVNTPGTGSYTFHDLVFIQNTTPTASRTRTFQGNVTVNGSLTATNTGGDASLLLVIDATTFTLTKGVASGTFSLGANVAYQTTGASNFSTTIAGYTTVSLNATSIIRFAGSPANQDMPAITYGNVEISGNGNKVALGNLDVNGNFTRTANNAVFLPGAFSHTIAGNWNINSTTLIVPSTSTITFDGTTQNIFLSALNNVVFSGSGTKTLQGNQTVNGNLTISNGVTVDANTRTITLSGNWISSGTGAFSQTTGSVAFAGSSAVDQTITSNAANIFGNISLQRPTTSSNVTRALTDIRVSGNFTFSATAGFNANIFDLNGFTGFIGGNWLFQGTSSQFLANNGTLNFNGAASQTIQNVNATITYFNLTFSGGGTKTLQNNNFTIAGNVNIDGVTVATTLNLNVAGNWVNTGTYNATGASTVTFNGTGAQNIGATNFRNLTIAGTGTKTLTGNITVLGAFAINSGATLDVSGSNYNIQANGNFTVNAGGVFTPQNGSVAINNTSTVTMAAGQTFYNLSINAPLLTVTAGSAITVSNDLEIVSGTFSLATNALNVGGNFTNESSYSQTTGVLTFNGTSGTKTFTPGASSYGPITINCSGATVQLSGTLTLAGTRTLLISNGTLDLNGQAINMAGTVNLTGGTLDIDAGASLRMSNGNAVTNNGGVFRVVGSSTSVANLTLNGSSGTYSFTQNSGTFHANNYRITNTSGNGINIVGGSLDATNNFSSGTFSAGAGTAYITMTGINLPSNYTITGVVFNAGPTYNVARTSGTNKLSFDDALGALAGNGFRSPGTTNTFAEFTTPAGAVTWTGLAGDNNWHSANNWSNTTVPTAATLVYLNHTHVAGAYTVNINTANAVAGRIVLDAGGGPNISLVLNGFNLAVSGSVSIGTGTTLTQTTATDQISVTGNWLNAGTFNEGTATVLFNGSTGTQTIATAGAADPFFNLTIDAAGAVYVLGATTNITNNITLTNGTLDVSIYDMNVAGNWSRTAATFIPRIATVNLTGTGAQSITGGNFYNFTFTAQAALAIKTTTNALTVSNNMLIGTNTRLSGGAQIIYVGGNWTNQGGVNGLVQTGTGAVIFNGANQTIGNGASPTTFRNIFLAGTGIKNFNVSATVAADMSIQSTVAEVTIGGTSSISGSGAFSQAGAILRLFNTMPSGFTSYSFTGGTVTYNADGAQNVAANNYFNLTLQRNTTSSTKTALGNIGVSGTFTINDANTTFNMGNNTLTVTGNYVHTAGAPQISWGASGTFVHDGAAWAISSNVTAFNNLVLSGTNTKTMGANLSISGDVTINSGVTLAMGTFTMTGAATKSLTINDGGTLTCAILAPTVALPTGFTTYNFGANSTYRLNGAGNQTISNLANYGNFDISTTGGTATLNGNTTVSGSFTMTGAAPAFADGGFNLSVAGATVNIRNYTPTAGTTLTLNGATQSLTNTSGGAPAITLHHLVIAGSGTKSATTNDLMINGNLTVDVGTTLTTTQDISLAGNLTVNGTLTHTNAATTFNFTGTSAQALNPGAGNTFGGVAFTGAGTKTFSSNGLTVGNGEFTIDNTTVNLGTLSHNIASTNVTFVGTGNWVATDANLTFNRLGAQTIPALTANNVTFSGNNTKTLSDQISVNDLSIVSPTTLDVDATNDYGITVRGNFSNTGTFTPRNGTVAFESNDGTAKTINNVTFYNVTFNQSLTSSRIYTLGANTAIQFNLTLGNGATLDLEGRSLTMGSASDASVVTVASGATLDVDANASLLFNTTDADAVINANGTVRFVGTSGNLATLNRSAGTNRIGLNMLSGSTVHARFYQMNNLSNTGIDINAGATVDNTNNFSDGTFSGINTAVSGGPYRYINFNSASTPTTNISNVTFNHGGTPTVGQHYNVARAGSASLITFAGAITGNLAGSTYEDDPGSKIDWPVITFSTWTGTTNTDWFTASNWSSGLVPDATTNVTIPLAANNPEIAASGAICKDLTITNGILQLLSGNNLSVDGGVTVGTGTNLGTFVVESSSSTITVQGGWTRGTNGIFNAGGSTVNFTAPSGTVSITPNTSAFGNLTISGAATFLLSGATLNVNGNFTQSNGVVNPSTANYVLNVGGNWTRSGGTFNTATAGTVVMNGAAQTITTGTFSALTISGTGTKQTSGAITIGGALTVNSTIEALSGSTLSMAGNVTINSSGTFNGGTGTHSFTGLTWTGTGSYSVTGSTINFARTGGTQTINASKFENLATTSTAAITLAGGVDIYGDLTIGSTTNGLNLGTFLINRVGGPAGTFTVNGNVTVTVTGANNFPTNFATYALSATSTTTYSGSAAQTIGAASYGNLTLSNVNTKTLGGDIVVLGNLNIQNSTLDVSTSNYKINVGGNFNNNSTGSFIARSGQVIFDGAATQSINLSTTSGIKSFFRIVVSKSAGTAQPAGASLNVLENITVTSGTFSANALTVNVTGNLTASGTGAFANSGTIVMNKPSGTVLLQMNGSGVGNLTLNGSASTTYQAQDNLIINGNFTLSVGTFDGNAKSVTVGNGTNTMTINGTYIMGPLGVLALGGTTAVSVTATGEFRAVGTTGNLCTITRRNAGNTYSFAVNGTIQARHYRFEFMNSGGININPGATINTINNFSDGTFTNGTSGGTFLKIENTQSLTGASRIENVSFPLNPGGGATNVTKSSATSGNLEFYNATGAFASASFENDPSNLIDWTGPITLTWNGSVSSDWGTAANWTASSGPSIVPNASTDVIINLAPNNCIISSTDALANSVVVNSGGILSINSATNTNNDLVVTGNVTITGFLLMNSTDDRLVLGGNWLRNAGGTFTPGQGTVAFNSSTGTKTLNNGATSFYSVEIMSPATVQLAANTVLAQNLTINSGATLDVTSSNRQLTIGGSYTNNGSFLANAGLVLFNATSGPRTITGGTSPLYDMTITPTGSVTYNLSSSSLTVTRNVTMNTGTTFNINGQTMTIGNNVTTPTFNLVGTFNIGANGTLRCGSNTTINVNSGGTFNIVGTSASAIATLTRLTGGTNYAVNINSGATVGARFYLIEFTGTDGIYVRSGATVNVTNTFNDGTFSNGVAGGRYLRLENGFGTDRTISNVVFNNGPTYNVHRPSGTGNAIFQDASGALAGFTFELDDITPASATTGRIRWTYTYATVTWNGSQVGGFWSNSLNWTPNTVPTAAIGVTIPNVGNPPVIDADADALNVTINSGATLTIQSNANLTVANFLTNSGTLTSATGSNSTITVGTAFTSTGTFNSNSSTLTLNATSGTHNLQYTGTLNNLTINAGATAEIRTTGSLTLNGNLTISGGTFRVNNAAHNIVINGNYSYSAGSYINGSSTTTFSGSGAGTQVISGDGSNPFHNVVLSGTRTKQLGANTTVSGNFTVNSGSNFNFNGFNLNLAGNFTATGATVTATSGTLTMAGTSPQQITRSGGLTLNNLTINNSSSSFPQVTLNSAVTLSGTLTLTNGRLSTTSNELLTLNSGASATSGSSTSFVSGPMRKIGNTNFTFPIGTGSIYARLGVLDISSSNTFTAQYFDASPGFNRIYHLEGGLNRVSNVEYWDLTRNAGTGSANVVLHWENGTRSGIGINISSLRVAHWDGFNWQNQGGSISGSQAAGSVTSTVPLTSFSPFTIGSTSGLDHGLPVTYSSIKATAKSEGHVIEWTTASEFNASYFTVERSQDGKIYEALGTVQASGTTNTERSYKFTDSAPLAGYTYYRLRQIDFDGTANLSPVVGAWKGERLAVDLKAWPQPVQNLKFTARISGLGQGEEGQLTITTLSGVQVFTQQLSGVPSAVQEAEVNLPTDMASGLYLLTIRNGMTSKTIRLAVQ